MKILFLTDNFYPENNAPAKRVLEHCKQWYNIGHEVTIITGAPNFPKGKVFKGYKNKIYQKENVKGITVKRVWTFIAENKGFFLRIMDYLSYMFSSFICGIFTKKNDVIIATSPQFFTLISGYLISVFKRTPLVLEIRDLWPESIVAVGAIKEDSNIIRFLKKIAKFLYKKSDLIICVTNSFKNDLVNMGIDKSKIKVVENGFDLNKTLNPTISINEVEAIYKIKKNNFIISFIGTVGMAHGLNIILDSSKKLKDVVFLVVGEGAEKKSLIEKTRIGKIKNIKFIDNISWQEIVNINQVIDLHLVHLKKDKEFKKVIPSKIFESMALKKPILMGVEGESRIILNKANCSLNIIPEDPESLVSVVNEIKDNKLELAKMGKNGYEFLINHFSRKELSKKMINYIEAIL
tara:strand:+ start:749 stop:1966 length:1218 start_codon:yes stop_codon:yes gene_type:complete